MKHEQVYSSYVASYFPSFVILYPDVKPYPKSSYRKQLSKKESFSVYSDISKQEQRKPKYYVITNATEYLLPMIIC